MTGQQADGSEKSRKVFFQTNLILLEDSQLT